MNERNNHNEHILQLMENNEIAQSGVIQSESESVDWVVSDENYDALNYMQGMLDNLQVSAQDIVQEQMGYTVSFFYKKSFFQAWAEISMMDKKDALSYLDLSLVDTQSMNVIKQALDQSDSAWFFNVLNVAQPLRNKGIGRLLVNHVTDFCREHNLFLLNSANSYGENGLEQSELVAFYQRTGMVKLNEEGLMVFHQAIKNT